MGTSKQDASEKLIIYGTSKNHANAAKHRYRQVNHGQSTVKYLTTRTNNSQKCPILCRRTTIVLATLFTIFVGTDGLVALSAGTPVQMWPASVFLLAAWIGGAFDTEPPRCLLDEKAADLRESESRALRQASFIASLKIDSHWIQNPNSRQGTAGTTAVS